MPTHIGMIRYSHLLRNSVKEAYWTQTPPKKAFGRPNHLLTRYLEDYGFVKLPFFVKYFELLWNIFETPTEEPLTWHILGQPYSLSSFEFSGILHVAH